MKLRKLVALVLALMMVAALVPSLAEAPEKGGTLTVMGLENATFFLPYSSTTADRYNTAPAIESLGRVNPQTGDMEPWLAEEFITDPQALTLTLKLRQGVKFSDGTDFNAAAVVWNFDKMAEYGKTTELCGPDSYEATDDYTIVMKFPSWSNIWADTIGEVRIYCPAAFEENGADWAAIHAVGTGAFVMSEYVQDSHVSYVRNDNYWVEGQPYLDGIKVMFLKDTMTQLSAFTNGEIDVLVSPSTTAIGQLEGNYPNISGNSADLAGISYMMFCSGDEKSPFYDVNVRKAVMHAVDWEGTADALYGGLGFATPLFAVPGSWAYDDSLELYSYDVALSKQMLSDAGYPNGFDTVITTNDSATEKMGAVILQAYLAEVGINAEIKNLTNADFNAQKAEGVYDLGIMLNGGSSKKDFLNNYIRLYSTEGVNYKNMMAHPEDYEEALFASRAATTLEEKKALLQKAAKLLAYDYCLVVSMGAMGSYCYAQPNVHDTGIYTTTAESWTPEKAYLSK